MKNALPSLDYELPHLRRRRVVIGVDEVGKGALAGPVFAGAFCMKAETYQEVSSMLAQAEVRDSKLIPEVKRERIVETISQCGGEFAVASSSVQCINELGIVYATTAAMAAAVAGLVARFGDVEYTILIDGYAVNHDFGAIRHIQDPVVKGDRRCMTIAAASILAKVARDRYMRELDLSHPEYGWAVNKGYGTQRHRESIKSHGATEHHRNLFIRNIYGAL